MPSSKGFTAYFDAFLASQGPADLRQTSLLFLKGVCMGTADVIPGVSGGTIALIAGIYEQLLAAIRSLNWQALSAAIHGDLRGAISNVHLKFLVILLSGIGCAILTFSRFMHFFLQHHPIQTWGFFFGLILASLLVIGRSIKWGATTVAYLLIGSLGAYLLVGMLPVHTPDTWWFLFFSGMLAICAMILPGISGAFILLVLGKYHFVLGMLKNPFLPGNLGMLAVFACGCIIGLLVFSRILNHLLTYYHNSTIALLCGLMAGSLRKIWPWKIETFSIHINGKQFSMGYENVLPSQYDLNFLVTGALATLGMGLVLVLHKISSSKQ